MVFEAHSSCLCHMLTIPANGVAEGNWTDAYTQAKALVAKMTDYEKADITLGTSSNKGCSGFTGSVSRLNYPGICLNDAESGIRGGQLVNGYASQLSVGASWNRTLAYQRGLYIGREFKTKGVNVALGPVIGPIGRVAKGGRNWEGFSTDPYLAGALVEPTIRSMQQSVIACAKHLIANEQETNRSPFLFGFIPGLGNQSVSSNIDDRTMHELYLWPWYDAVRAEVGSVMCSYNRINGSHGCQNSKVMNGLLKTELGFPGFVVTDWYAQHTGIASNKAGLDMVMPSSMFLSPLTLSLTVLNGSVPSSRLNDEAVRIVAAWYRYAQLSNPGLDGSASVDARKLEAEDTILQSAVEGQVLVKNINNALPLGKPRALNLFGYDAIAGMNKSSDGLTLGEQGLGNTQSYTDGKPFTVLDFYLSSAEVLPDPHAGPTVALNGTLLSGGGSGSITPNSSVPPYDAFKQQAARDNTTLYTDFNSSAPDVVSPSSPCIVFINTQSSESWDRSSLSDGYSDDLVLHVASQCRNTIVSIHNAGIRIVDAWIDHPNVTAVIYAHTPGQASGTALVEVMYGNKSPSGRLPYTVAKQESDYGALLDPTFPTPQDPLYSQSNFTEGLNIDYKHFISTGIAPRFAFGFGLTYSSFSYSSLSIDNDASANTASLPPDASSGVAPQGGLDSLYDIVATVSVTIANTGSVAAAEVPQLYVGIPDSGQPMVLRGFDKILLQPGASGTSSFALRRRDLSIWDVVAQQWRLPSGDFDVYVGKSVLDIQLNGTLTL